MPAAIADIVRIEQGATTIPWVGNEPLASRAPISSIGYQWCASAFGSAVFEPRLQVHRALGGPADQQVDLNFRVPAQFFEHPKAVDRPAGARDGDDNVQNDPSQTGSVLKSEQNCVRTLASVTLAPI